MTEKIYSRVTEAEEMVRQLCGKQPEVLWCVRPQTVAVMGVENKERPKKARALATVKPIKGCEKAILQDNHIPTRYIVELYWSDWREWKERKRQWIIFHELLHIHNEVGKTIKHDCEDFRIILDKVGVDWQNSETLPDLVNDKVEFKLELRPSMEEADEEAKDEIDEEEVEKKKKKGKSKIEDVKEDLAVADAEEKGKIKKDDPTLKSDVVKKDGDIF